MEKAETIASSNNFNQLIMFHQAIWSEDSTASWFPHRSVVCIVGQNTS